MKTTVGRTYRFRATHSLPDFPKPYCHPHEHDYTVIVEAEGGTDTNILDSRWQEVLRAFGLNGPINLDDHFKPSTVENIAERLFGSYEGNAVSVTVWEDKQRWGRAER